MKPRLVLGLLLFALPCAQAQVSASAYRVLGQTDLRQDGVNLVQGVELYSPEGVAVDSRGGQVHVYISDTLNSRVLASDIHASGVIVVSGRLGEGFLSPRARLLTGGRVGQ